MAIGIRGIRIETVSLSPSGSGPSGNLELQGTYSLISTADKVLATQQVNGYGGIKLNPSPSTVKALDAFLAAFKSDMNALLGLEGAE